jgi:hypothetical protein
VAENAIDLPLQTRADVRLQPDTIDAEARSVEVVWSTGATVRRRDLWTGKRYDEVLSLDPRHVDLSRLNSGAPLLNTHDAFDLAGVIGVVERAWIARSNDSYEGRATVRLSAREDVEPLWQDVRAGIIRNVSVGYVVRAYEVTEQDGQVPVWRAVDWQPVGLSAVPVGADGGTGFVRARVSRPAVSTGRSRPPASPGRSTPSNRRVRLGQGCIRSARHSSCRRQAERAIAAASCFRCCRAARRTPAGP